MLEVATPGILLESARQGLYLGSQYQRQFERSLRLQLLFQPSGIVLPDSYLFSSFIWDHLKQAGGGSDTVLDIAIEHGLLTILARGRDLETRILPTTFTELLSHIRSGGIFGLAESSSASSIAAWLDTRHPRVADRGIFKAWPRNMGKALYEAFVSKLDVSDTAIEGRLPQAFESGRLQEKVLKFHKQSAQWREFAHIAATGDDLRFSEVLRVTWEKLLRTRAPSHITISKLQHELRGHESWTTNREFFSVLGDLQNLNFADAFGVQSERVDYTCLKRFYSDPIGSVASHDMPEAEASIRMPSAQAIRSWTPEFMVACRMGASSPYPRYEAAFKAWSAAPLDAALQGALLEEMTRYAEFIVGFDDAQRKSELRAKIKTEYETHTRFALARDRYLADSEQIMRGAITLASVAISLAGGLVVGGLVDADTTMGSEIVSAAGKIATPVGLCALRLWLPDLPVELFASGQMQLGRRRVGGSRRSGTPGN